MFTDDTRKKLENIVRGVVIEGQANHCAATRNFLCSGFSTSKTVKKDFESQLLVKKRQVERLEEYATENQLWVPQLPDASQFLAKGGESKVYKDRRNVIKINDAIYYATWLEYFNSLVLHNLIFQDTEYTFLGFAEIDHTLQAIVSQPFITSDSQQT